MEKFIAKVILLVVSFVALNLLGFEITVLIMLSSMTMEILYQGGEK
jgi:hypothetical protein